MMRNAFSVVLYAMHFAMVAAIFLAMASRSSAQVVVVESEDPNNEQPTTYKMTVSPAAEPRPALKYRFLVPPVDQIKGNAATFYYKSMSFEGADPFIELNKFEIDDEKSKLAYDSPLEKFPREEVAKLVEWLNGSYGDWLWQAARCDSCDWEDDIRAKGISLMLPQVQHSRGLARALMLRARLQIVDGQYDDAFKTLAISYSLSRNLGHGTTLIHSLVGIAIQGITGEQTKALIACENSPNLYWALTDLAAEPIDLRQAMSYESKFWEFTIHELPDLDRRVFTPQEMAAIAEKMQRIMTFTSPRSRSAKANGIEQELAVFAGAVALYPQAKSYLLANHFTPEKIEAMPITQVVLLSWWKQFDEVRDNYFKWLSLSNSELRRYHLHGMLDFRAAESEGKGGVFTLLLPAIQAAFQATNRSQRQIEILRVVEALRMHAAEHGSWPESLDRITMVPVPLDPWTEKPFFYSLKGDVAIVEMAPNPPPAGGLRVNQRYELTLRKAKQK
jgi:hypothetical protein